LAIVNWIALVFIYYKLHTQGTQEHKN